MVGLLPYHDTRFTALCPESWQSSFSIFQPCFTSSVILPLSSSVCRRWRWKGLASSVACEGRANPYTIYDQSYYILFLLCNRTCPLPLFPSPASIDLPHFSVILPFAPNSHPFAPDTVLHIVNLLPCLALQGANPFALPAFVQYMHNHKP